jgi:hypothetical protein
MKSDNLLFHYTDICAAKSILQSGVLYFSHHQKMNDKTEFFHADKLLFSATKQVIKEVFKQDRIRRELPEGVSYKQTHQKLIRAVSGALGNDYYIFSSTQHADKYEMENGSLVMWRGYGKENGCAIVFQKDKLVELADSLARNGRATSTIDGEICYLEDANELCIKFENEYRNFLDYINYFVRRILYPTRDHSKNQVDGLNPYIRMKALAKHPAFKSENEYRLSILRSIPDIKYKEITDKEINLIPVENGRLKLPIAIDFIPINKIIISPSFNQDDNYKIMREFIKSSPKYLNIQITKSAIPYKETPSKP